MTGNAAEWVEDAFAAYPSEPQIDPCVVIPGADQRILRGGKTDTHRSHIATWSRSTADVDGHYNGLRVCLPH